MTLPDVNILINAFRTDAAGHAVCKRWLDSEVGGDEPFGLSPQVLSSFLRIVTNPKSFPQADPIDDALGFCTRLLEHPNCKVVRPGPKHWQIFCDLCRQADAKGDLIPDAWFAALAIESGCVWITLDRDFARFEPLRWSTPF
jgi:toxin-antitoxin system PIN domain toxin